MSGEYFTVDPIEEPLEHWRGQRATQCLFASFETRYNAVSGLFNLPSGEAP